jgi:acyl-CoA synthetase (AMP-forming)/AMP-acid ligase II
MLPRELMDIMIKEAITHISFTPSILSLLVDSLDLNRLVESKLRTVGLGGENPSEADIARLKVAAPNVRVFNRYGPTEAAVAVSSREVTDDLLATHEKIPLGLPGPGVSFHLVDVDDKIVNANLAPGELCIGGVQVMAGYLGDPETTASVLRSDLVPGELIYRTGDLVQRNAQGEYVYLDRLDNIVKRNGVRISLAEITAALRQIEGVSDAACIADARSGRTIITAYVSGDGLVGSKV